MQAAMAGRNNSAGLKASGRPLTSVSSLTSASLQRARLPCASVRFATTLYSSILAIQGFDPPGSALHDSNAGGVLRCDGSIDGSNNRPAARENIGCQMSVQAPNGHADAIERCPLLGPKRKTSAPSEYFAF